MNANPNVECEPIELLHGVALFSELEPDQMADLVCRVEQHAFAANETIFRRGDPGDRLYVIQQGRVRIEHAADEETPMILRVLEAGEFFGELALCDGKPRSGGAVAMEPTRALSIRRDVFQEFLSLSPRAGVHIISVLCERLRSTSDRLSESYFYDTASRLARRLLELAKTDGVPTEDRGLALGRAITPDELAELVGATVERIHQELDSLEQDRIIALRNGRITVVSTRLLQERIHRKPSAGPGAVTIPTWLLE